MSSSGRALLIAPLFLRLTLGTTLLWTGMGGISATFTPSAAEVESLRGMGAIRESVPASDRPVTPAPARDSTPDTSKPDSTGPLPAGSPPLVGLTTTTESESMPRLYLLSLQSLAIASPHDSNARALWPKFAVTGEWPKFVAWTISVGSVVSGSMLIAGLFVRLCGLLGSLFVGIPLWLFLLAPAIQSGGAKFGFLPAVETWDLDEAGHFVHTSLMWSILQIGVCWSLLFSGAGFLSLDRALFSSTSGGPPVRKPQPKRTTPSKE